MILNLGSINIDLTYKVPHIAQPGETISAYDLTRGLGGKGANMSVAAAQSGAQVLHFGAVGPDGDWALETLRAKSVDCDHVQRLKTPTGQAIILVDDAGENAITLLGGANRALPQDMVLSIVNRCQPEDWILAQNETSCVADLARSAAEAGKQVAYVAAPFDATEALQILPHIKLLVVNEIEAAQLTQATGTQVEDLGVELVLVTRGAQGAELHRSGAPVLYQPAMPARAVVDTTGAGDTFLGYFLGRLSLGDDPATALRLAAMAATLAVERPGAISGICALDEVQDRLRQMPS